MDIGYRTVGFADLSTEEAVHHVAEAGYDSVELCLESADLDPLKLSPARVAELRALLDASGLRLAAVSYHGLDDQLEVRRQRTYAAIRRLGDLGAQVFVVASRREEPARLNAQWLEALQLYTELGDLCAEQHCRLAVEPQPGLVVRNSEDLVRMLRECDHPNVAANLDIAHAASTADDLSWAVYQLGPRLANVHLADITEQVHQHLMPGTGEIDFDEVRDILDGAEYQGALVIDIPRANGHPDQVCREALAAFRKLWGT